MRTPEEVAEEFVVLMKILRKEMLKTKDTMHVPSAYRNPVLMAVRSRDKEIADALEKAITIVDGTETMSVKLRAVGMVIKKLRGNE